ncbi:MAG: hypothetical protein AAFS10_08195, partial [Myxococcota bacterium]
SISVRSDVWALRATVGKLEMCLVMGNLLSQSVQHVQMNCIGRANLGEQVEALGLSPGLQEQGCLGWSLWVGGVAQEGV